MKTLKERIGKSAVRGYVRLQTALGDNRGEGYVDTIVKMAIAVVVGALILGILIAIIGRDENSGIMGTIKQALDNLFKTS